MQTDIERKGLLPYGANYASGLRVAKLLLTLAVLHGAYLEVL